MDKKLKKFDNTVKEIQIAIVWVLFPLMVNATGVSNKPSKDSIHVVGHAHMDMNWLWTYSETLRMCNDNLRQAVAFSKEFPDFVLIQSQAAVYDFVERVDPFLFRKIQEFVKKGQIELGGGMWTEGDANLSSGEALSRSFLLGQSYFLEKFGKNAKVGWLPDNFGHPSQLPQMLKLSGMDYFYFHRCKPHSGTFWWVGSDSSKVLCYSNDTYNGDIIDELKVEVDKFSPEKRRILHVTGVGDHGGGPTRANIEMAHQLNTVPGYPSVKFSSAHNFFRRSQNEMEGRPVHFGEMQFIFEGCYTTVADIKEGNRKCENMLYSAEFFNTLGWLEMQSYPKDVFTEMWKNLTFNQFHDILPGSATYEANKEAVARYTETLRKATELRDIGFRRIADRVDFQKDKGLPVVVFNLHPGTRRNLVEADVFSYHQPATAKLASWVDFYGSNKITPLNIGQGDLPSVRVYDNEGNSYPAQVIWGKVTPPGFTSRIQFVADNIPGLGYRTFYFDMEKPGLFNQEIPFSENTFDTDFFKVSFDMQTGGITSLFDKRSGKEYVRKGGQLNTLRIYSEENKGWMKAWTINKISEVQKISDVKSVKVVEKGPVRACIETVKIWGSSRFVERTYIYRSYPRIDYDIEVHWLETGSDSTRSPMLRACFPLEFENPTFHCHVPFDVVERPANGFFAGGEIPPYLKSHSEIYGVIPEKDDGQEVPAQKWVDVTDGETGISLLNNSKYGHSYHDGELRLTLMRSAGYPDLYPNIGKFQISYALFPHLGNWKNGVWDEGELFNVPVFAAHPPSLSYREVKGPYAETGVFLRISNKNIKVSAIKPAEEGGSLILRLIETEGKYTVSNIQFPFAIESAQKHNLIEIPLDDNHDIGLSGNFMKVKIKPHEIVTIAIKPEKPGRVKTFFID